MRAKAAAFIILIYNIAKAAAANIVYMRVVTRHLTLYVYNTYIRMDVQDFAHTLVYIYTNIRVVYNNGSERIRTHTHMASITV